MRKVVAFCLTSSGTDDFSRMQRLACDSLRFFEPECAIHLVVDEGSYKALKKTSPDLLDQFDQIWPVQTPSGPPGWVNRWLKTGLRTILDGEVLYLDADLIVRGSIAEIWNTQCDVGGVLNGNTGEPFFSTWDRRHFEELGWELPAHGSLNGGVIFWRDSEGAYAAAECYRARWLEATQNTGRHNDQPALNRALADSGAKVGILHNSFNAMETYHPRNLLDAKVWHFMNSGGAEREATRWHKAVFSDLPFPPPSVWAEWDHPWILRDPVARFALASMNKEDRVSFKGDWRRHWVRGESKVAISKLLWKMRSAVSFNCRK